MLSGSQFGICSNFELDLVSSQYIGQFTNEHNSTIKDHFSMLLRSHVIRIPISRIPLLHELRAWPGPDHFLPTL